MSQILQAVLDKNMHDIDISFLLEVFNKDMSFYSCITLSASSKFCQEVCLWQQLRLDVLYLTAKLQFSSTDCIFIKQGLEQLPTIQHVFKTQIKRKARK